jgi:hypothetical protein
MLLIEAILFWFELSSQAHTWTMLVCREVERIEEVILSAFGLTDLPPCWSGRLNIEGMGELLTALQMGQLLLVHPFTSPAAAMQSSRQKSPLGQALATAPIEDLGS